MTEGPDELPPLETVLRAMFSRRALFAGTALGVASTTIGVALPQASFASGNYQTPCNSDAVNEGWTDDDCGHRWMRDDWQGHKNRCPASVEPGTDYVAAYGSDVHCAEAGSVADRKDTNSGATGRYVAVDLDDGRRVRYLHLSAIHVAVGDRVTRGQVIASSGASGFGSDNGYGAHVHVSLWDFHGYAFPGTIDFELYTGVVPPVPPPLNMEDDMPINFRSTTGGISWTMVPGVLITRHYNETAADFTNYVNTGKTWPGGASQQQREAAGERQLSDAEILMILPHYGFRWMSADIARLPDVGQIGYSDVYRTLLGLGV